MSADWHRSAQSATTGFHQDVKFRTGGSRPIAAIAEKTHPAAMIDIYESAVQAAGRFRAVYERDDETAYFYLLDMQRTANSQIISAFAVDTANRVSPDLPVSVTWSEAAAVVGLFIDGALTAIFDVSSNEPHGRLAEREDDRWFQPN